MKTLFIITTNVILLFSVILLLFGSLNYSGFCFREFRYLSPEEEFKSLFNIWNKSATKNIYIDGKYEVLERKKIYANFEEFLKKHPNCCEINPEGGYDVGSPFFTDRIFGYDSGRVILLEFNEEFIDSEGNVITKKIQIVDRLQNCGESYW